jgi:Ca2+-binding RTX toxin-like protein
LIALGATATALAVTLNGDGTLIGCSQAWPSPSPCTGANDTINAGNANDTIYGLAGSDTINAGNGDDTINGDGTCPMNVQGAVHPFGFTSTCMNGQGDQNGQRDTINAGNGNDTVLGGGGNNTINVGRGKDFVYGGPHGDTISTGANGTPTVYLCGSNPPPPATIGPCASSYTGSTINIGTGSNGTVYARNGFRDTINCGNGSVKVYADGTAKAPGDTLKNCKNVVYGPSHAGDVRRSARHGRLARHRRKHHIRRRSYTF